MPISGTVETFFGDFELNHSFPTGETANQIYDLMDHQRAAQLYLWGLPLVGMTRWLTAYQESYESFDYNTLVSVRTFNERRGILTANETTDYLFGFSNTREAAAILEIPGGASLTDLTSGRPGATMVGMMVDMWQESPSDVGIFGPNRVGGGKHVIVGPNTPPEAVPERRIRRLRHVGQGRHRGFHAQRRFDAAVRIRAQRPSGGAAAQAEDRY